ncbi:hypothetical protein ACSBR2_021841 [Camellia fascicularis]
MVNWTQATDCCRWKCVTCDKEGHVTGLDLNSESISGRINHLSSLFSFQFLQNLNLAYNNFNFTQIPSSFGNLTRLTHLNLSNANFAEQILIALSRMTTLVTLDLSTMYFLGAPSLKLENPNLLKLVQNLTGLKTLLLDGVNILAQASQWCEAISSSVPNLFAEFEILASLFFQLAWKISGKDIPRTLPDSVGNLKMLSRIEFTGCNFNGTILNTMANLTQLIHLDLSSNSLTDLEKPYKFPSLPVRDLHSNQLYGEIPIPPESVSYVDYSSNNFNSSIPAKIGNKLTFAYFFSLSTNSVTRTIPESICNARFLNVLDLSNNNFSGIIPPCLIERSIETLGVLNLRNNSLGVLRSNKFHGGIHICQLGHCMWPKLQIIDLASNNFSGDLPDKVFLHWTIMIVADHNAKSNFSHLQFEFLKLNGFYYQDTVTLNNKGMEMELAKILTIFTSIDISNNNFQGVIPNTVGFLKSLYVFNTSHNAFTGPIPSSIGCMQQLGSLDLSQNRLSGSIPICNNALPVPSLVSRSDRVPIEFPLSLEPEIFISAAIGFVSLLHPPSMNISPSTWIFLFIILSINLDLVHSKCLDHELLTLLKLKQSLTFDTYLSSSKLNPKLMSWNSSTDCCSWAGVTCNDSHVIGLDLSSELILGGIGNTSDLFDLQYLQSLNLAKNSFNAAQIPFGLGKLVRLVHLNFSNSIWVSK